MAAGGQVAEAAAGRAGDTAFMYRYTGRNNWGATQTEQPRVPVQGNEASKPLPVKTYGGCGSGRNYQPHRRVRWRDPHGPRMYTNPPTQGISTRRDRFACGWWGKLLKAGKSQANGIVPSLTPPPHTATQ